MRTGVPRDMKRLADPVVYNIGELKYRVNVI